jgi:hydrogenase maturation protease
MNKRPVTVVLGLGNVIQSDDGIGVKAVECLREIKYLPIDVKLIDGGPLGLELVSYLGGVQRLIVIDAIDLGNEPGTIARLGGEDLREVSNLAWPTFWLR